MPRCARIDAPGAVHHVMVRGIEQRRIFHDDDDRHDFLARLGWIVPQSGATCYAWALMPNHAHLVLRTGWYPLASVMARLNTGYARRFNLRHQRVGHLFQNRYKSRLVDEDIYLLVAIRYVHRNPLRGGDVRDLEALARYPWCGHAALMGHRAAAFQAVEPVLQLFGSTNREARARLEAWMAQPAGPDRAARPGPPEPPEFEARPGSAGGDARLPGGGAIPAPKRDSARRLDAAESRALEAVLEAVCCRFGVTRQQLRSRERKKPISDARAAVAHLAREALGVRGVSVSDALGLSPPAVSRACARGREIVLGCTELRGLRESKK